MKHFIKKIFYFFFHLILLALISIITIVYVDKQDYSCKLEEDISIIYVGDSHIEAAINDRMISNSKNIGASAEFFYYSYFKLKLLLNENPSISTVYLGLGFHSISSFNDKYIKGKYAAAVAPKYFYLLPFNEQKKFIKNSDKPLSFILRITKYAFIQILSKNNYEYMGGFRRSFKETEADVSIMDKRLANQYYNYSKLKPFSELNIYYLDKIIEMCKSKGVELYALNTPVHDYYYKNVPNEYKEKLDVLVSSRKLKYINLSKIKLTDNCFTPDGDHVSKIGANKTTIRLKQLIMHKRTTKAIPNKDFSDKLNISLD